MNLADFVKLRRGNLGMSQASLARATKGAVSSITVCDIERGRSRDLKASMIFGLAKALKVKPPLVLAAVEESLNGKQSETADGQEAHPDAG